MIQSQPYAEMAVLGSIRTIDDLHALQTVAPTFSLYGGVYETLLDYVAKYGTIPPRDVLAANVEGWEPPDGDFAYWLEQYRLSRLYYDAGKIINNAIDGMETDVPGALNRMIDQISALGVHGNTSAVATDGTIEQRFGHYLVRAERFAQEGFKLWGIPTGISAIDGTHQGWMPGELIGVIARPETGKTWFLLWEGVHAWMSGRKVLLISPEMPAEQIAFRIDALMAGMLGIPFSAEGAKKGHPAVRAQYEELVKRVRGQERWHTIEAVNGKPTRLEDVAALYRRYEPDLILIDGIILMGGERDRQTWEKMMDLSYGLKTLATSVECSIMVANQATNKMRGTKTRNDGGARADDWILPSLNDSAFGDSFAQAMSTVITLAPDRESPKLRWYSIRKSRDRGDIPFVPRMALGWDVDRGVIADLGKWKDDLNGIYAAARSLGIEP